jgi:hypothetical protein
MGRLARANGFCLLVAGLASGAMAWLGLYSFAWNDYEAEAEPALQALVHGHVLGFLQLAPLAYGGSLVERAPFALLAAPWGGDALAVYRLAALPCLAAAAALAVWLCAQLRAQRRSALSRALALALLVANPLTLDALELGHPEELLGASLCVAAVALAARRRAAWAAVALGLAIANKPWALLALGPVLLVLPAGHARWRARGACGLGALAVAAAVLAPLALARSGSVLSADAGVAAPSSTIFQPWQLWWFFGHHGALVHGLFGAPKPGYRTGPAWAAAVSHPLVLGVGALVPALLWWRRRRRATPSVLAEREGLLALALLLLARCLLDTWDTAYYMLPFIFALTAWELDAPARPSARARGVLAARLPVLALSGTLLAWVSCRWLPEHGASPDLQAALFAAWALPLVVVLALALRSPARRARAAGGGRARLAPAS